MTLPAGDAPLTLLCTSADIERVLDLPISPSADRVGPGKRGGGGNWRTFTGLLPPNPLMLSPLVVTVALALLVPRTVQSQPALDAFMASIRAQCGRAFEGRVIDPQPVDSLMARERLVMHVRGCGDTLRIPFHVGENRSRTWVFTRAAAGVRLKHDHRHEDGFEDAVTQYGGDARPGGTAERMEFAADAFTAGLIPAARTNVWTVEITGTRFVYQLRREGTDRRFRVEFDLTRPVTPPPAPWGAPPG